LSAGGKIPAARAAWELPIIRRMIASPRHRSGPGFASSGVDSGFMGLINSLIAAVPHPASNCHLVCGDPIDPIFLWLNHSMNDSKV
jgi:hypothetical protein